MHIIVSGSIFSGIKVIGPFERAYQATEYAQMNVAKPWEVATMEPPYWYVAVYLEDRAYGGPEEGGWYYDTGELQEFIDPQGDKVYNAMFNHRPDAEYFAARLRDLPEFTNEGRPNIGSVNSIGQYRIVVNETPMQNYPEHKPHYD